MKKLIVFLLIGIMCSNVLAAEGRFTGNVWIKLSEKEKVDLISFFKAKAKDEGVIIKQAAGYYAFMLDVFYEKHPEWKKEEVNRALKTLIIMDYDWEERGVDKDALAKQWLGEEIYKQNRERFQREEEARKQGSR